MKRIFANLDIQLLVILILLSSFGLMMVYSSSFAFAMLEYGSYTYFFKRQLIWLILGLIIFLVISLVPYQLYGKWMPVLTIGTLILLVLVLIPGVGLERNFSRRWLGVGPLAFQPSEIAKIVMVIYFAKVYTNKALYIRHFRKGLLPPLLLLVGVIGCILMQPDLGTSVSIIFACGGILLIAGGRWNHIMGLVTVAIVGIFILAISEEYRMKRLVSYLNPFADPQEEGFQLVNSYIAIGDGGVLGHGLGRGIQKLGYLPEAHTDFIMAIISEELGIIGLFIVLGLFLILIFKGFSIYRSAPDRLGQLLAFGITAQIASQAIMNLGAVSGLLPITGIPLPLISYGGTSLFITLASLGILMNISRQGKQRKRKKSEETIDLRRANSVPIGRTIL